MLRTHLPVSNLASRGDNLVPRSHFKSASWCGPHVARLPLNGEWEGGPETFESWRLQPCSLGGEQTAIDGPSQLPDRNHARSIHSAKASRAGILDIGSFLWEPPGALQAVQGAGRVIRWATPNFPRAES